MVMAQSLFMTLQDRDPSCEIDVLAPKWSLRLTARMPEVNCGIEWSLGHGRLGLLRRLSFGQELRSRKYRQAIVLPRSFKSALIPLFAHIPTRTGYRGEMRYGLINDMRVLDPSRLPQTVQRFVSLGLEPDEVLPLSVPHPHLIVDSINAKNVRKSLGLSFEGPVVCMAPGAEYGPAKQWPLEHYAALVSWLIAQGAQVWLLGSARDKSVGDRITELAGGQGRNLCGLTELDDSLDLIAQADVVITNDSGLLHVAAALGRPLVAIYGSSTPAHTPPLSDYATTIYLDLECSPCFARSCPLGHTRCLTEISVAQVQTEVEELLNESSHTMPAVLE